MRHGRFGVVVAWTLTLLVLSVPGHAQQTIAAHPASEEQGWPDELNDEWNSMARRVFTRTE